MPDILSGLALGPNCLQRLSADDKIRQQMTKKHNNHPAC